MDSKEEEVEVSKKEKEYVENVSKINFGELQGGSFSSGDLFGFVKFNASDSPESITRISKFLNNGESQK